MRKIISVILLLALTLSVCACAGGNDRATDKPNGDVITPPENEQIAIPEYKDYGRGTSDFDKIKYSRPSAKAISDAYADATAAVKNGEGDLTALLQLIRGAEDLAYSYITLSSYAEIMSMKDVTDEYWSDEFAYLSENRAAIAKASEDLYVACAQSEIAEELEDEYFGEGFIEQYRDGGKYTDTLVELMRRESELENEYSTITDGSERQEEILVELIKVRKLISNELGDESYLTYAYEGIYHDYSPEEAVEYILDIPKYILPVYLELSSDVFSKHFNDSGCPPTSSVKVINDTYDLLLTKDGELAEVYSYMLQHKLFDISSDSDIRFDGSFCTYLYDYNAPFVFISAAGDYRDYSTLSHEFGHFADAYFNYGDSTSLDLAEVSSQGLEYILLTMLKQKLTDSEYKALYYSEIESALEVLLFQGFYALFEHYAYELDYNEISEERLIECMRAAAYDMGLNGAYFTSLSQIIIPHIMLYPTYVQSYCTSVSVALELFVIENKNPGEGLKIYKDLIMRDEGHMSFSEYLADCKLTSPFKEDYLRQLADGIYYEIVGSHYYKEAPDGIAA